MASNKTMVSSSPASSQKPAPSWYVMSSSANSIVVRISDLESFEAAKSSLQVGRYLKIAEGNQDHVIGIIREVRGIDATKDGAPRWTFELECQPVGTVVDGKAFTQGSSLLPVPLEPATIVDKATLDLIFAASGKYSCALAPLSMNNKINLMVDGDSFFGKHLGVVGSTGSGKSCAVTKLLHDAIGIANAANKNLHCQKNSHVIIFDFHAEYRRAFTLPKGEAFQVNVLDVESMSLPYWLMNSEELESLFIESNEANSHNQVSQFKHAVIANKEKHNPGVKDMTYDCPVYFSIREVCNYIENVNREVIGRLPNENKPKLSDDSLVSDRKKQYFDKVLEFATPSQSKDAKAGIGPFHGEFNRFISRLETTLSDKRLRFLLDPKKKDGTALGTDQFQNIVKQFTGYLNKSNVTVVDLSGIPFEVMSITISLVSRLLFDFCFHYSKLRHKASQLNDVPFLLVCEEAHNYVPRDDAAQYRSSRKSIERIAKEGRKYGLSLMVVSQRPSEVSETIFAQCSNFVALRLTNSDDQSYVRHLLPNNMGGIADVLPNLAQGECLVVGDAVLMPAVVRMGMPNPDPQSTSVKAYKEWQEDWKSPTFEQIVKRWQKDEGV